MPVNTTAVDFVPVNKAGDTMTGFLTLNADPVSALQAVTKQYADAISAGLTVKAAVVAASTVALTATYANGAAGVGATLTNAGAMAAFALDSVSLALNDRVLIKNQSSTFQNGIYIVTTVGSGAVNWVLTRAADYDQVAEIQPGNLVLVNTGSTQAQSSWIQTDTVTTIGTDPIEFSQFTASPNTFAVISLSNLAAVAIGTSLLPATDGTVDIGGPTLRWNNGFFKNIQTGTTAAQTTLLQAYNTNTAAYVTFATLTANNPPTMAFSSAVTGTTQAPADNSTKLATTAYADAVGAASANVHLSNLASVAINTALLSAADSTLDLGSAANRWVNVYGLTYRTGQTNGNNFLLQAYNTGGASYTTFATLTAGATPTMSLNGTITTVTQSPGDNSTRIASTAYVDASTATGANVHLSNLASVAINTSLLPGVDNTIDAGDGTHRYRQIYTAAITTGTTAADTFIISARDVDGASDTAFITLTANNTPTCVFSGAITGVTQAPADNSTKLATTAYADNAASGGGGANTALSNLAAVAINTTLVSDTDVTDDLGTISIRWNNLYAQNISTDHTAGHTVILGAWDVDGTTLTPFFTLTANNTPTGVLASGVTGTTQSASDNSTKLATTAYADAQVVAIAANKALSNLASVAINTDLLGSADNSRSLGSGTVRFKDTFTATLKTGTGAGNTILFQAYDVDGAVYTTFATLTANNTPTFSLEGAVTSVTQSPLTNNTTISTTAYTDAAVAAGGGGGITIGKAYAMALLFGR